MTEVSHAWLDRVVVARQRSREAYALVGRLSRLTKFGDEDSNLYSERAEVILTNDGTSMRLQAIRNRLATLDFDIRQAECYGRSVGPVLLGLTEVIDTLNETILNTEALLEPADDGDGDPFIDRLEEHPAYERN